MDLYLLARFGHFVGFVLLGGGLLAVFVSELRAYRTADLARFAEAAWYTARFYDALVLPGAVLVAASGTGLILLLGLDVLAEPWLAGMIGLFAFEFIEGNTVTRIQFHRTLRLSEQPRAAGRLTDAARDDARSRIGQIAHFLDLPLYLVIIWCAVARPDGWPAVLAAIAMAIVLSALLTAAVPRLVRPG